MAMSNKAKVSNLIYLTENGGTQLVRALFLKRMFNMKPHNEDPETWTLDMFLKMNREKIKLLKLNKKFQVLFPAEGKQTNISFWDLSLLISILKTTCELSTDMKMKLSALKKLRDKLAHLGDSSITNSKYKDSLDKLHLIFEIVLNELNDEELENKVKEMFQKVDEGEIPDTEISSALEALHRSCEDIKKSEEETRNTVKTEHNATRNAIEKGNTELRNILEKLVDSKDNGDSGPLLIVPAKLKPLNGTTETDEHLTQVMLDLFNKEISQVSELHELLGHQKTMRDAVHMFYTSFREKGYEILKAENGCIMLHVRFAQIKSLFSFYLDYINGDLDIYLDELETAAKCYLSFEELSFEMILYEDDLCQVLRDIGTAEQEPQERKGNLTYGKSEDQQYVAGNRGLYVQDGGSTSVLLTFKPISHFDGKEFESVLESEAKRLIQNFKLPHQSTISRTEIREEKDKEKTGQDDLQSTRESSTVTSFDECRFTTADTDISLKAENDRLRQDLQKAKEEVYKTANRDSWWRAENDRLRRDLQTAEAKILKTWNTGSSLRDENDRLRRDLHIAHADILKTFYTRSSLRAENDRLKQDLQKANEDVLKIKVLKETDEKEYGLRINDLTALRDEQSNDETVYINTEDEKQNVCTEKHRQLDDMREEIKEGQKKEKSAVGETENERLLKQQNGFLQKEIEKLRTEYDVKIKNLLDENLQLQRKIDKQAKERQMIKEYDVKIKNLLDENLQLQHKIDKQENERQMMKERLGSGNDGLIIGALRGAARGAIGGAEAGADVGKIFGRPGKVVGVIVGGVTGGLFGSFDSIP